MDTLKHMEPSDNHQILSNTTKPVGNMDVSLKKKKKSLERKHNLKLILFARLMVYVFSSFLYSLDFFAFRFSRFFSLLFQLQKTKSACIYLFSLFYATFIRSAWILCRLFLIDALISTLQDEISMDDKY